METKVMELCERLGIEFSEELIQYYERGLALLEKHGDAIFDTERFLSINAKYNIFRRIEKHLTEVGEELRRDPDMVIYNYMAAEAITDKIPFNKLFSLPDNGSVRSDHAATYAVIWHLEGAIALLEAKGIPHNIISDSLNGIESEILAYYEFNGRYGTRGYIGWYSYFLRGEILRVGRLQYQFIKFSSPVRVFAKGDDVAILMDGVDMHKKGMIFGSLGQDDEAGKYFAEVTELGDTVTGYRTNKYGEADPERVELPGYTEVLRRGDNVLSVHITNSEPFNIELVRESFREADAFFPKYYPELDIKAYYLHSWLAEKRLRDIISKDTNITMFADMFHGIPTRSGQHGAYNYLFSVSPDTPVEQLPENSSMQRAVKKYMLSGNYFYDKAAIRLI